MRIVHLSSEVFPYCRSGGLGDVVGALPHALASDESAPDVAVFLPLHRKAMRWLGEHRADVRDTGLRVSAPQAGGWPEARILEHHEAGPARVFFVDAPHLFDRESLYSYGDDGERYAAFSRLALRAADSALGGRPDILHAHDWHTALAPVYAETKERMRMAGARTVLTIHNLAYQGVGSARLMDALDLDWGLFRFDILEFHGHVNFFKGGLAAADAITTVSPSYAREILTPQFGFQLDGHLRARAHKLQGILNGLDTDSWNPASDPALPEPYGVDDLRGKAAARAELLRTFGLTDEEGAPVIGVVSRFTAQKGLDLAADLIPHLAGAGARIVVLGTGEPSLEDRFRFLSTVYGNSVGARIAFDSKLARLVIAGSDMLWIPSRFEPCGLTQLQAMRYGTIPVVHATGGLRDTVIDVGDERLMQGEGTGFRFEHPTVQGLHWATARALRCCVQDPEGWQRLQRAVMSLDFSWGPRAQEYLELYRSLLA